jgi:hypothetical protein
MPSSTLPYPLNVGTDVGTRSNEHGYRGRHPGGRAVLFQSGVNPASAARNPVSWPRPPRGRRWVVRKPARTQATQAPRKSEAHRRVPRDYRRGRQPRQLPAMLLLWSPMGRAAPAHPSSRSAAPAARRYRDDPPRTRCVTLAGQALLRPVQRRPRQAFRPPTLPRAPFRSRSGRAARGGSLAYAGWLRATRTRSLPRAPSRRRRNRVPVPRPAE